MRLPVRCLGGQLLRNVRVHEKVVGLREIHFRSPNECLEKGGPTLKGSEKKEKHGRPPCDGLLLRTIPSCLAFTFVCPYFIAKLS